MRKCILVFMFFVATISVLAQGNKVLNDFSYTKDNYRSVRYNALGMGVLPSTELMFGGNHISYKKIGFGLSWRLSGRNLMETPSPASNLPYDTALAKGFLTGNTKTYYSYSGCINFVVPITKKIPLYAGFGAVRQKMYAELIEKLPNGDIKPAAWNINEKEVKFNFTFTAGTFIPLTSRVVLNLAYDHFPQTFFIGIAINHPFNYEDIDMW